MAKLKEQFLNSKIYVSLMNSNVIGKFIPQGVQEKMIEKYPELFESIQGADQSMVIEIESEVEAPVKKKLEEDEEII